MLAAQEARKGAFGSADALMRAWAARTWLTKLGGPLETAAHVYAVHDAMVAHPLCSEFGGVGGWKLGGIGALGERAINAPLFQKWIRESPASMPAGEIHLHTIEAEFCFELSRDLLPQDAERSYEDVVAAIEGVRPAIECCGRRIADGADVSTAGRLADALSSGGVVRAGVGTGARTPRKDSSYVRVGLRTAGLPGRGVRRARRARRRTNVSRREQHLRRDRLHPRNSFRWQAPCRRPLVGESPLEAGTAASQRPARHYWRDLQVPGFQSRRHRLRDFRRRPRCRRARGRPLVVTLDTVHGRKFALEYIRNRLEQCAYV